MTSLTSAALIADKEGEGATTAPSSNLSTPESASVATPLVQDDEMDRGMDVTPQPKKAMARDMDKEKDRQIMPPPPVPRGVNVNVVVPTP